VVVGNNAGNSTGNFPGRREVEKFIRSVGVGVRTQDAGDEELSLGELFAQHRHERNRSAFAGIGRLALEESLLGALDRLLEPWLRLRRVPPRSLMVSFEPHAGSIGRVAFQQLLQPNRRSLGIAGWWYPE
jgi:hypothetical protein